MASIHSNFKLGFLLTLGLIKWSSVDSTPQLGSSFAALQGAKCVHDLMALEMSI